MASGTTRALGQQVAGKRSTPNTGVAVTAVALAGGIMFYDLRNEQLSEQDKLRLGLSFGLGAVLLIALAEVVPELGVPLSVMLLLVVAVARPKALNFLSGILAAKTATAPAGPSGPTAAPASSTVPTVKAPAGPVGPVGP